jgi:hypothetical protein
MSRLDRRREARYLRESRLRALEHADRLNRAGSCPICDGRGFGRPLSIDAFVGACICRRGRLSIWDLSRALKARGLAGDVQVRTVRDRLISVLDVGQRTHRETAEWVLGAIVALDADLQRRMGCAIL